MRRIVLSLIVASMAVAAPAQKAQAYSLMGGQTLGVFDYGLQVTLGYPGLDARFHIPLLDDLEIIPRLSFFYSGNSFGGGLSPDVVGNYVGADVRLRLLKEGRLSLALAWELGAFWSYDKVTVAGLRLALPGGVKGGYQLNDDINLVFGANMPIGVIFTDPEVFTLPIEFGVGAEVKLTEKVNLIVYVEGGPVILLPGVGDSSVQGSLDASIGVQYLL
ncbi:MAG: hypothetical protein ACI9WU_002099 [Myxococcota bacterium]|jgi:hypothetical protein